MLRGLDVWGKSDGEPTIIKAADRDALSGSVTVYVSNSLSPESHDRLRSVLDNFDRLEAAEVVDDVRVTRWPETVEAPTDGPAAAALACYDEFADAVGADTLEPHFEEHSGEGAHERTVEFADICVAIRDDGELTGLYPRADEGASIEDCLTALAAGNPVENV
ncbi:hypothetical protein HWV23_06310 [Natronomonas halophila]|uniref:HTH domain-containing protein n=1 Tax=Natronomonas halophila TaxID=2747817 RepID=UPI0015B66F29|nr:HTH domain-containing protein [Natronomonas halophila]QLD85355.1 hypothetical protein HWV23_06310 [Natronomonas halophila]